MSRASRLSSEACAANQNGVSWGSSWLGSKPCSSARLTAAVSAMLHSTKKLMTEALSAASTEKNMGREEIVRLLSCVMSMSFI